MTAKELKEDALVESRRGLVYMFTPDELEDLITTTIAEHEAGQWKAYPENKPDDRSCKYMVHLKYGTEAEFYWNNESHKTWDEMVVAFRELPKPYKP